MQQCDKLIQHCASFVHKELFCYFSWLTLSLDLSLLKSSPFMIHRISTLTFKFHPLLTIETWRSTIPVHGKLTYASRLVMATSNPHKKPMGAIMVFPEATGAYWERLPYIFIRDTSSDERAASGIPCWCRASCIPEELVFTRAAPHDWKCWL